MGSVHVMVLAAGEGTRMRSALPKVLHRAAGRSLVDHVVRAALGLKPRHLVVVVPPGEHVSGDLTGYELTFAVQDPPAGTADAVAVGCRALNAADGALLVVNGDCPGVRTETLARLLEFHGDAAGTCLTVAPEDVSGYGRVLRDGNGDLLRIVEEADASERELAVGEINAGIYCFDLAALRAVLDTVGRDNVQGELYLTDVFGLLRDSGQPVRAFAHDDAEEVHGVNTRAELARAEALLHERKLEALMSAGVTVRDPATTYVDIDVEVGSDTVLYPGVVLEQETRLGSGCTVYPHVRVSRSRIGNGVIVWDGSVIEDSIVRDGASIGPYGRLRPGTEIGPGAKIGNFVETKKTKLGAGSKANHLTYLGDATIGEGVNVGAGTITCNYDGKNKFPTVIEDGAFIGSNTALVAPVRIGAGAYVGAGSTITEDVPDASLGLARGRQVNKEGWASDREREASSGKPADERPGAGPERQTQRRPDS